VRQLTADWIWPPVASVLFPKLKITLRGNRFNDVQITEYNETEQLLQVPEQRFSGSSTSSNSGTDDYMLK
jgi:hypothetical protein